LWRLIRQYLIWQEAGWAPDVVLVYNLAPIYNYFIRWLHRQANRPVLVLLLLDSPQLGRPLPWLKRLRYHFKPLVVPDAEMLDQFDGCIGLSPTVAEYFRPLGVPFLWMPGGCAPDRATTLPPPAAVPDPAEPIRFGYFGALASHAGVGELVKTFLGSSLSNSLRVCGYGKLSEQLAEQARRDQRLRFHGLLPSAADCLRFGQSCDVLINPRPPIPGNENTFPSKVFEYGLCGRAILSAQLSGVPVVLGEDGFYFDERDFERSLAAALAQVAALPRSVLHERGRRLRERLLRQYSWEAQAVRMARFLRECSQRQGALSRQPPARP
jgi:glycosyltransferase involved in cell wall biosynthesis